MRFYSAALLLVLASPVLAQTGSDTRKDCPPGQTASSADCKPSPDTKPDVPPTNMKDTVIPKAGGDQKPIEQAPKAK